MLLIFAYLKRYSFQIQTAYTSPWIDRFDTFTLYQ